MMGYYIIFGIVILTGYVCTKVNGQGCQCSSTDQYSVCNCLVTWSEAEAQCRSRGSHMVKVRNEEENEELSRVLNAAGVVEAWIGGKINTGDWRWTASETPLQGQGCHKFTGDLAQFDYSKTGNDITPSVCMFDTCKPIGFDYAAVTRGDTCICMGSRTTNDLGSGCDLSCSGDANERCGGTTSFYLYHTEGTYSKPWGRGLPDSSSQQPLGGCLVLQCRYNPFESWVWTADQCTASPPRRALCETEVQVFCDGVQYGNTCYIEPQKFFFSWFEASHYCHTIGGHLAEIPSQETFEKISSDVVKCFRSRYWIGGTTSIPEWVTGQSDEPVEYTNWNSEFPTFARGDSCMFVSNYVSGSTSTLHKWGDQNCNYSSAFVCMRGEEAITSTAGKQRDNLSTTSSSFLPVNSNQSTEETFSRSLSTDPSTVPTEMQSVPTATTKATQNVTTPVIGSNNNQGDMTSNYLTTGETSVYSSDGTGTSDVGSSTMPIPNDDSTLSATDQVDFEYETSTTTEREYNTTIATTYVTEPVGGISGAEVGGAIMIAVATLIVVILCVLAIYYSIKVFRNYLAKKRKRVARDSPKGPFVRDIDFSYMDVTRAGSMESKTKGPVFDKEKSLQRYNSLDIDKELKKEQSASPGNENINCLNNQTQIGSGPDKEDDTKPLSISNKGLFDYIDNVGVATKDSNLQVEKEILQQTQAEEPSGQSPAKVAVITPASVQTASLPKQKTVIQITTEEDVIKEETRQDSETEATSDSDQDSQTNSNNMSNNEKQLPDTNLDSASQTSNDSTQSTGTNDGYIHDDFEDADYAHPREYSFSYV